MRQSKSKSRGEKSCWRYLLLMRLFSRHRCLCLCSDHRDAREGGTEHAGRVSAVYMCVYVYICICVYECMCIHAHTHAHTHTHTCTCIHLHAIPTPPSWLHAVLDVHISAMLAVRTAHLQQKTARQSTRARSLTYAHAHAHGNTTEHSTRLPGVRTR